MQLHPRKLVAGGVLLLAAVVLSLVWMAVTVSPPFRVLDPAFKVVDVRLSRGRVISVYCAGLKGRWLQKLHEFGIPVQRFGGLRMEFAQETLGLALCYGGDLSAAEVQSIQAVLLAPNGQVTVLSPRAEFANSNRKEYGRGWVLDPAPPLGTILQVRAGTNRPLMEMTIQK